MRTLLVRLLVLVSTISTFTCVAAMAATGPSTAWNVFTLPNPQVTPNWRTYAPSPCQSDPEACAKDHRFWELWKFSNFQNAIDASFSAVQSKGKYQGVMMILPLGDTTAYWNNIQLMYKSAAGHGVQLEVVVFPKWKYGAEYCYLYKTGAPSGCQLLSGTTNAAYWNNIQLMYKSAAGHGVQLEVVVFPKWKYGAEYCYLYKTGAPSGCQLLSGTTNAVANQKLLKLMKFVQTMSGACTICTYHRWFAAWYGWNDFSPGYSALKSFWQSLPTNDASSGCNLQASYITWLDTPYSGLPEVKQQQNYVVTQLKRAYWVNTELYSTAQLATYYKTYSPYQTIITGYWGASDAASWGKGMCTKWNTAFNPIRLGAWTFDDPDLANSESYRSYINGTMATIGSICTY